MVYHRPEFQHECINYEYPIYQIRPFGKTEFCILKLNNYIDYAIYILGHDPHEFYKEFMPKYSSYVQDEYWVVRSFSTKKQAKIAIDGLISENKFANDPDNFEIYPPIKMKD